MLPLPKIDFLNGMISMQGVRQFNSLNDKVDDLVITAEKMKKKIEVYNNLLLEHVMWENKYHKDPCRNTNALDAFDWMASSGQIIDRLKSDIEEMSKDIDKKFEQAKSQVEGTTSRVLVKKRR